MVERPRQGKTQSDATVLGPRDRLGGRIGQLLAGLPRPVQRVLAGRPVRIDGQVLDAGVQLLLRFARLSPETPLERLGVDEARAQLTRDALALEGRKFSVARVEALEVPGPGGPIAARLYVPDSPRSPLPLLVYLHGGGWVRGSLETHDNPCRFLARTARVMVASIDYRLAPEHPFPAAVDDTLAAFRYMAENAGDLGADPAAIALGGDSAGGNLTAAAARLAADGGQAPAFMLIFYPATDFSVKRRSYRLFGRDFLLTESKTDWYRAHYLPDEAAALDPRASPLLAQDFSGLPPAYIATAGFDVLRDEGEEYAARLRAAGVPVTLRRHAGLIHGFANQIGIAREPRAAMAEAADALRLGLSRGVTLAAR